MNYDALEYAAYEAQREKRYRTAFGLWKELVTRADNDPYFKEPAKLVEWIENMNFCQNYM